MQLITRDNELSVTSLLTEKKEQFEMRTEKKCECECETSECCIERTCECCKDSCCC